MRLVSQIFTPKQDCENRLGQFLDQNDYDFVLNYDADVYRQEPFSAGSRDESNVILKFRKGYFTADEQFGAYDGLRNAAKLSNNRGYAAGPVGERLRHLVPVNPGQLNVLQNLVTLPDSDLHKVTAEDIAFWIATAKADQGARTLVWLGDSVEEHQFNWDKFIAEMPEHHTNAICRRFAQWVWDNLISDTNYANPVFSGVAGYFGRYPRRPWAGPVAYTEQNMDKFQMAFPYLQSLSKAFAELLPERSAKQWACAKAVDPAFTVPGTPFTTITVNRNFRTAAHRDDGDLARGFSNLSVVTRGDKTYEGGYLVLPEIRAAVDIRPGDLLLVSNHEYIHGNTLITGENMERISLVCYFRENMMEAGSAKYEALRHDFVEFRRLDPTHPKRNGELWNGVSPGMWTSEEWKHYILTHGTSDMLDYTPEFKPNSTLDGLFT